jgi:hypothetical protein
MVHALLEARRVLVAGGIVIDSRPVTAASLIEAVGPARVSDAIEIDSYGAADDEAAADAAIAHALSHGWFVFERSRRFDFEVYCDTVADLRAFVETSRRMHEATIPYRQLEEMASATGQPSRLRCHRPSIVNLYRKPLAKP